MSLDVPKKRPPGVQVREDTIAAARGLLTTIKLLGEEPPEWVVQLAAGEFDDKDGKDPPSGYPVLPEPRLRRNRPRAGGVLHVGDSEAMELAEVGSLLAAALEATVVGTDVNRQRVELRRQSGNHETYTIFTNEEMSGYVAMFVGEDETAGESTEASTIPPHRSTLGNRPIEAVEENPVPVGNYWG